MPDPSKIVERYVVAFVDADGKVVGYLDRDRKRTDRRELAFEFDEDYPDTGKLIAEASVALHGTNPFVRDPQTFIEVKELWELTEGGPA